MTTSIAPVVSIPQAVQLTSLQLFCAFSRIALSGFGGVLPFAYYGLVEKHKWLSAAEFAEFLGMSQMLPGPTICNVAMMVGHKFAGTRGAFCALGGMICFPFLVVIFLGIMYQRFGDLTIVRNSLSGMGAVAAGLILSTAIKMGLTILREKAPARVRVLEIILAILAFAGLVIMEWQLLWLFSSLAVIGTALLYGMRGDYEQ